MKIFALIPKNFSLNQKLTTLMLTIFLGGIIVSGFIYYHVLFGNAKNELNRQANALISTMDSVRKYNADKVTPLLEKQSQSEEEILLKPEAIPSVAMTEIFKSLTRDYPDKYGGYSLKNAMINPTNPDDEAKGKERDIIDELRQKDEKLDIKDKLKPENNVATGFITINGEEKFYTARPIIITEESCLRCHASLGKSPKSLQNLYKQRGYSDSQGFGWKTNEVIGTKIIYVPTVEVYKIANQNFFLILGIFIAIFAIVILLVNLWLKQYIVRPLKRMMQVSETVTFGNMDANFEKHSNDEIGQLADAFTRMKTSLEIAIKRIKKLVTK